MPFDTKCGRESAIDERLLDSGLGNVANVIATANLCTDASNPLSSQGNYESLSEHNHQISMLPDMPKHRPRLVKSGAG